MNYFNHCSYLIYILRNILWVLGIPLCLLGIVYQEFEALADGYVSNGEFLCSVGILFVFVTWITVKPNLTGSKVLKSNGTEFDSSCQKKDYALANEARTMELKKYHIVSQLHVLPFPYLSQIYHLLNLKHLETVHGNTLGRLRVTDIYDFQSTPLGGSVKFKTTISSPINILKIWRSSTIDVKLTLHNPNMVELSIPVYGNKKMIVLFKVFPFDDGTHKFLVDIYTDLSYPKFLLRSIFHFASIFTIYEDLPYLKKLSSRDLSYKISGNSISSHITMCLFKRFVNLYGSDLRLMQNA